MTTFKQVAATFIFATAVSVVCACPPPGPPHYATNAVVTCSGGSTQCDVPPVGNGPHCQTGSTCPANNICSYTFVAGTQCQPGDVAYCNPPGGLNPGCDTIPPPSSVDVSVCGTKACADSADAAHPCLWSATCTPPRCTPSCNGNAPVTCNAAGNAVPQPNCGSAATCVNGACQPIVQPVPVCTPGLPTCTVPSAIGECMHGTSLCPSGCAPGAPTAEVCDGKDNDCNGIVDDLKTTQDIPVNDSMVERGGDLGGISDNKMYGPSNCGGTRVSATATKLDGGGSWCAVEGWADVVCANPKAKVGNSDFQDACKVFAQQGGHPGNNANDCRYIVHVGASSTQGIRFQASHVVRTLDHCP